MGIDEKKMGMNVNEWKSIVSIGVNRIEWEWK
jgi:hypothetical protein